MKRVTGIKYLIKLDIEFFRVLLVMNNIQKAQLAAKKMPENLKRITIPISNPIMMGLIIMFCKTDNRFDVS